ncbi:3-methyladenine DNA glycosylase/8-oxoguanine DNA glycosylase [Nakamurella sp. UYEF19]|uniref:DNA-3-methyladenine glycosylase family protein n=1 Tax=Nakamurella sp. UYEF19 TaxID=1756392 RepID=UPI00339A030E
MKNRIADDMGDPMTERVLESARPVDLASTIGPLRHGPGDPCHSAGADGTIWRTSMMPTGPVTYLLDQLGAHQIRCRAWGPGAAELIDGLGDLLGETDDSSTFAPEDPKLVDAHRRHPGLRIPRTGRVLESLIPAILEQKVTGKEAFRAWRVLVTRHGTDAPGPAPTGMRVPPTAEQWRMVPSWDFHRAGVDPKRSSTVVTCARFARQLEGCTGLDSAGARARLMSIPGIGAWTAAEVGQRALGDADALSVGDFHLSGVIGWTMLGRPIDDAEMVAYLEPLRPHRHRVVRLLEVSGQAFKPRFGPRITIQDHRGH